MKLVAALVALVLASPTLVAADDCAPEADELRAHLEDARRSTRRWNLGWGIAFGAAAAGQVALAVTETNPIGPDDERFVDMAYVGAAKATIGMLSHIVLPIGVRVPARQGDRCAELVTLRAELQRIAIKERRSFWLTHLGGFALNVSGALLLWHMHDAKTGLLSFAVSYPVGVASAYTLPRATWKRWRVSITPTAVAVGGTF